MAGVAAVPPLSPSCRSPWAPSGRCKEGGQKMTLPPRPYPSLDRERHSLSAQEHLVQFADRYLVPSRPAMVALTAAFGSFHLAQQSVHLRDRELSIGAHGGVACHRAEQLVTPLGKHAARTEFVDVTQHFAGQLDGVSAGE